MRSVKNWTLLNYFGHDPRYIQPNPCLNSDIRASESPPRKERPTSNRLPYHPFGVDVRRNNAFFEGVGGEGVKTVNSSQLKFDKMTTILDALQNANYNLQNAKMPLQLEMAKAQLHNAVTLLEKDYDLHDDIGEILSKYEKVEDAPEKTIGLMLES